MPGHAPTLRTLILVPALALVGVNACASSPEADDPPPRAEPGPAEDRAVDAGSSASVEPAEDSGDRVAQRPDAELEQKLLNHALVKLKADVGLDDESLKALIQKELGLEVSEVRPGPVGIKLLVFPATDPPRDEAARDALHEKLRGLGVFEYVEPNRMMKAISTP